MGMNLTEELVQASVEAKKTLSEVHAALKDLKIVKRELAQTQRNLKDFQDQLESFFRDYEKRLLKVDFKKINDTFITELATSVLDLVMKSIKTGVLNPTIHEKISEEIYGITQVIRNER